MAKKPTAANPEDPRIVKLRAELQAVTAERDALRAAADDARRQLAAAQANAAASPMAIVARLAETIRDVARDDPARVDHLAVSIYPDGSISTIKLEQNRTA